MKLRRFTKLSITKTASFKLKSLRRINKSNRTTNRKLMTTKAKQPQV